MEDLRNKSLGELVGVDFRRAAIFEKYQLDYCCGGKQLLGDAAEKAGINAQKLIIEIEQLPAQETQVEWKSLKTSELIDYIIEKHHKFTVNQLGLIQEHLAKVVKFHGQKDFRLAEIQAHFTALSSELIIHMQKEEQIVFPILSRLEQRQDLSATADMSLYETHANSIGQLVHDHDYSGHILSVIRGLTGNYQLPTYACATLTAVWKELEALEKDLHQHVYLENEVLFRRALEMDKKLKDQKTGENSQN